MVRVRRIFNDLKIKKGMKEMILSNVARITEIKGREIEGHKRSFPF